MFEQGSNLRVEDGTTGYQSVSLNGVLDFRGDMTNFVADGDFQFNNGQAT